MRVMSHCRVTCNDSQNLIQTQYENTDRRSSCSSECQRTYPHWEAEQASDGLQPGSADGILQSIENANVTHAGEDLLVTRKDARTPVEMVFTRCQGLGVQYEENQWWVLPISATGAQMDANRALWILPLDATSKDRLMAYRAAWRRSECEEDRSGTDGYSAAQRARLFPKRRLGRTATPSAIDSLLRLPAALSWKKLWLRSTGAPFCRRLWRRPWRRISRITTDMF